MRMCSIYNNPKFKEFIKFCIVGGLCTIIDAGIYYLTYKHIGYRLGMILGFTTSIIFNYFLNVLWAFKVKPSVANAIGVFSAHCFNIFVVRMTLMWIFVELLFIEEGVSFIPTLIISTITNFFIIRLVVQKFTKKPNIYD